jgi:hypothetical protein
MERWAEEFANAAFRRSADTAHDLKTPLNVAMLNLELLRMRARKLGAGDDASLLENAAAIDSELRRLAAIFDAYFVYSTPPHGGEPPAEVDFAAVVRSQSEQIGVAVADLPERVTVRGHEPRLRELAARLLAGAAVSLEVREARAAASPGRFLLQVEGTPPALEFESSKLFKFYYTDPSGTPDLSLATARLIAETYGGSLTATEKGDTVVLELSLPAGEE